MTPALEVGEGVSGDSDRQKGLNMTAEQLEKIESAVMARLEDDDLKNGERRRLIALAKACSGVRADLVRFESKTRLELLKSR